MSARSYIHAMPKVEVNLHFEGAIQRDTLVMIAEQNDIPYTFKQFAQWKKQLERPNFPKLNELIGVTSKWLLHPEDFSRIAYEIGVSLAKQNVRYAEVGVNPILYVENNLTFEQVLNALNDGRDRAEKGWPIKLNWILTITADQVRKADDVIRWVTSTSAKKGGVVGLAVIGGVTPQILAEFERPLHTLQKKGVPYQIEVAVDPDVIRYALDHLNPNRIALKTAKIDPDSMRLLSDRRVHSNMCITKTLRLGHVSTYAEIPLRQLNEDGMVFSLASEIPSLYGSTIQQEYETAFTHCGLSVEELESSSLNAVAMTFLPDEEKSVLAQAMQDAYAALKHEHQVAADTTA
jgi:adenosine deaminase